MLEINFVENFKCIVIKLNASKCYDENTFKKCLFKTKIYSNYLSFAKIQPDFVRCFYGYFVKFYALVITQQKKYVQLKFPK